MKNIKPTVGYSIGAVERDVGIRSATLRIWERRYGFPKPVRADSGDRVYPEDQLEQLRLIRRLMNHGFRPGAVVAMPQEELHRLLEAEEEELPAVPELQVLLEAVQLQDGVTLIKELERMLLLQGLREFVLSTIAPFLSAVGDQWAQGKLQIYQEHFVTRQLMRFLDSNMSQLARPVADAEVIVATLPGEQHSLGSLMVEMLLSRQGIPVYNLGTEVPIDQLVEAVEKFHVRALALSFSGAYPYRTMRNSLRELADRLPEHVEIWVGGAGTEQMQRMPNQRIVRKRLEEF